MANTNKLGRRKQKAYMEEIEANLDKHIKFLTHHLSSVFLRYANEVYKLNRKYFAVGTASK